MSQTTDEVVDLERGFWTQANDRRFFEQNFAADGITVLEPMGFLEKDRVVAMAAQEPWQDVRMTDVQVRQVSPDCVILAYHGQGRHEGDDEPYRGTIASTYVRLDGRWQLALTSHQPWKPDDGASRTGR